MHDHVDGKFLVSLVPIVDTHSSLAPSTQSDGPTFKKKHVMKENSITITHDLLTILEPLYVPFRSFTYLLGPYGRTF